MNCLKRCSLFALASLVIVGCFSVGFGQVVLPQSSQKASVTQRIGVTDVTINYFRPGVKGRKIWGDPTPEQAAKSQGEATLDNQMERPKDAVIVPYGHVWRTGANDATQFVVNDDVMINGQKLAAGTYSLHSVPTKDEWTIVFNGTANQWGSFNYDASKDTLRVKVKPSWVNENQEWLAFSFEDVTDNSAVVKLRWEKISVPFTVSVDVNATTLARLRKTVAAAKADDWRTPNQAGTWVVTNNTPADDAEGKAWLEQAVKGLDEAIKVKPTFQMLVAKANALYRLGKKEEAIATGEQAVQQGKTDKANTAGFEQRLANMKAGKI